ncbi:MAG: hypothetical protein H0W83_10515 [Planctomycetes bacterium]|nr:hypothetical protein [Planctomycetota bacterium]
MRTFIIAALAILSSTASFAEDKPAAAMPEEAAAAKIEWREVETKDVPLEVKKALIAECDKVVGDGEVKGFKYFQTSTDAKEPLFKAQFRVAGKIHTITCKPTGEIASAQAKADPAAEPPAK